MASEQPQLAENSPAPASDSTHPCSEKNWEVMTSRGVEPVTFGSGGSACGSCLSQGRETGDEPTEESYFYLSV